MLFSAWDAETKTWSYFEGSKRPPQPARTVLGSKPGLGVAPEDAAPRLPLFAKKVGSGLDPKGQVVEQGWQLPPLGTIVLWFLAGYGLWTLARRNG